MEDIYRRLLNNILFDILHPSLDLINIYLRYAYNKINSKLSNEIDYSSEIFWWEQLYYRFQVSGKKPEWWDSDFSKGRCSDEMRPVVKNLLNEFNEELRFIDVGSGAVTSFFYKLDINKYNITTVDPLAKLYNSLNEKYNINYPLKCTEGTGETLNDLFEPETFHLALTFNAIDHSKDLAKFMKNLFYVTKPQGYIYVSGLWKIGTFDCWLGLHQNDIEIEGNDLIWTTKTRKDRINLTKDLDIELVYKFVKGSRPGDLFTMIYKKMGNHS